MASSRPRAAGRFLPPDPRVEEPYRLTPQLALRIAVLGMSSLAVFAVLFLRLWALQVLSGSQYLARRAEQPAAHGPASRRRAGRSSTATGACSSTTSRRQRGPDLARRPAEARRPAHATAAGSRSSLDVPRPPRSRDRSRGGRNDPLTPVTLKRDVPGDKVRYLYEHQAGVPRRRVARDLSPQLPLKALAAQVLGYVGEISQRPAEQLRKRRCGSATRSARAGSRRPTTRTCAGSRAPRAPRRLPRPAARRLCSRRAEPRAGQRDPADDRRRGCSARPSEPSPTASCSRTARQQWYADGGAIVALDPRDGEVLAMASNPTYKPSVFVGRTDREASSRRCSTPKAAQADNYPALNRATAGLYPPGLDLQAGHRARRDAGAR